MSYNQIVIEAKIKQFLEDDCKFKDVSSDFIPQTAQSSAKIIAKSDGVICGLEELKILYHFLGIFFSIL